MIQYGDCKCNQSCMHLYETCGSLRYKLIGFHLLSRWCLTGVGIHGDVPPEHRTRTSSNGGSCDFREWIASGAPLKGYNERESLGHWWSFGHHVKEWARGFRGTVVRGEWTEGVPNGSGQTEPEGYSHGDKCCNLGQCDLDFGLDIVHKVHKVKCYVYRPMWLSCFVKYFSVLVCMCVYVCVNK